MSDGKLQCYVYHMELYRYTHVNNTRKADWGDESLQMPVFLEIGKLSVHQGLWHITNNKFTQNY